LLGGLRADPGLNGEIKSLGWLGNTPVFHITAGEGGCGEECLGISAPANWS